MINSCLKQPKILAQYRTRLKYRMTKNRSTRSSTVSPSRMPDFQITPAIQTRIMRAVWRTTNLSKRHQIGRLQRYASDPTSNEITQDESCNLELTTPLAKREVTRTATRLTCLFWFRTLEWSDLLGKIHLRRTTTAQNWRNRCPAASQLPAAISWRHCNRGA